MVAANFVWDFMAIDSVFAYSVAPFRCIHAVAACLCMRQDVQAYVASSNERVVAAAEFGIEQLHSESVWYAVGGCNRARPWLPFKLPAKPQVVCIIVSSLVWAPTFTSKDDILRQEPPRSALVCMLHDSAS